MDFRKLPSNSEGLLLKLVCSENPTQVLRKQYNGLSTQQEQELDGIIRELKELGYIDVKWADNEPYFVILNNSARTYSERLAEYNTHNPTNATQGKKEKNTIFISHRSTDKGIADMLVDFFAGSGTTGNAVLKYNAEHEGSARRFILCTNNENGICRDVTYERIRRVIDKEDYAASLKYYKVDYVPISDRMYYEYADELLRHIRELVELENGINFTGNEEIAIVLTEDELAAFIADKDRFAKCRRLYMGHDLLPDEAQETALFKSKIEISIIPDYYYRDLQEG